MSRCGPDAASFVKWLQEVTRGAKHEVRGSIDNATITYLFDIT